MPWSAESAYFVVSLVRVTFAATLTLPDASNCPLL